MLDPGTYVTMWIVESLPLAGEAAEDVGSGCWTELEDGGTGASRTEEDESSATGGATGGSGASSEQPKMKAARPKNPKEINFFFMITKYSLQK